MQVHSKPQHPSKQVAVDLHRPLPLFRSTGSGIEGALHRQSVVVRRKLQRRGNGAIRIGRSKDHTQAPERQAICHKYRWNHKQR